MFSRVFLLFFDTVRRLSNLNFNILKISDWRKKEWHTTTDGRTGNGLSGKKPRKKYMPCIVANTRQAADTAKMTETMFFCVCWNLSFICSILQKSFLYFFLIRNDPRPHKSRFHYQKASLPLHRIKCKRIALPSCGSAYPRRPALDSIIHGIVW